MFCCFMEFFLHIKQPDCAHALGHQVYIYKGQSCSLEGGREGVFGRISLAVNSQLFQIINTLATTSCDHVPKCAPAQDNYL